MTTRQLAAVIACLALIVIPAAQVQAAPTRAQSQAELDRLASQISRVDEDYNVARITLTRVERQIRDVTKDKQAVDGQLKSLRAKASARAAAVYRLGYADVLFAFFGSSSPSQFQKRMEITSKVGDWEAGLMDSLAIANERSADRAEALRAELARAKSIRDSIAAKRALLQTKVTEQRKLLDRIAAAEAASTRPKRQPAPQVARPDLPASGNARVALQTAYAQIGKPYRWGAAGPDSFDCSGLTMYSWRAAGVSLPHSSRAQFSATKRVARGDLQPGDLVFFGSPIHHVGMYVGGSSMINSPETGERVGIRSMERRDYVGAGRPGV